MLRFATKGSTLVLVLFLALIIGALWEANNLRLQNSLSTLLYGQSATSTGKAPGDYQTPLNSATNAGVQLQNS